MSNSTEKEKWWMYPALFLIGVLSLPLGLLIMPLSGILAVLQNTLCATGWCGFDLLWAAQFIFPFLICSILVSLIIYFFKVQSRSFVLKVLVISFAAISLLFFGGLSILNFIQLPIHPFFIFIFIMLIIFLIGLMAFKKYPLSGFAIKAFALSFAVTLLTIFAWIMIVGGPTYYIDVSRFDTIEEISLKNPELKKIESAVITAEELEKYPTLKNAINGYDLNKNEYGSVWSEVEPDERERTNNFIEQKWRELWHLFSVDDKDLKEELEQMEIYSNRPLSIKLRKVFENHNISLPEDAQLFKLYENVFSTSGFEIRNEEGSLNFYPNRYDNGIAIKFGDKFYMITFPHGD